MNTNAKDTEWKDIFDEVSKTLIEITGRDNEDELGKIFVLNAQGRDILAIGAWTLSEKSLKEHTLEANFEDVVKDEGLYFRSGESRPYTGKAVCFRENGGKRAEADFEDGKYHGKVVEWYENGTKKREENWKDGEREGKHIKWDEEGNKITEEIWEDGKLVRLDLSHTDKHALRLLLKLKSGLIHSDKIHREEEEKLEDLVQKGGLFYEAGETEPYTGEHSGSCDYGEKTFEAHIKDGKYHGTFTVWNNEEQKVEEDNWRKGKPQGKSIRWDDEGKKRAELTWEGGKLVDIKLYGMKEKLLECLEKIKK